MLAEQRLVDGRVLQRVVVLVGLPGVGLQIGRLRVALHGLAGRGDLGVHGLRVRVGDAVPHLDVERVGVVLAVVARDLDPRRVDAHVLVIEIIRQAQSPYLVGLVLLRGVEVDRVVAGVAQQHRLAVDRDGRVALLLGLGVLLRGVEDGRQVEHLVRRGQAVVQGQHPLVADLVVGGGILPDGALEADLDARAGGGAPLADQRLVLHGQLEQVPAFIPPGRVLRLRHDLAGVQVHHLDGLLVRHEVLVIGVRERHARDHGGQVGGQLRLGGQLVLDLLARVDDLAVHALLAAALRGFRDHVLLHRRHVAADLRLVGRLGLPVHGLAALVGQLLAVRRGAERDLVARLPAEVLAHPGRALAVREVHGERDEQGQLQALPHALQGLQIVRFRGGGRHGALDLDVEHVGHVGALVRDVRDAGPHVVLHRGAVDRVGAVGLGLGREHPDLRRVLRIDQIVGGGPVVGQLQLGGSLLQTGVHGAVHRAADRVPVEELHVIRAGPVRLARIHDREPLAVTVQDPALVRVRLPGREPVAVGLARALVVPRDGRRVRDLRRGRQRDRDGQTVLECVPFRQVAALPRGRGHIVRGRLPVRRVERELRGHVLAGGRVRDLLARDLVRHAVRIDRILDDHPLAAHASARRDHRLVRHAISARALLHLLRRRGRRRLRRLRLVLVQHDDDQVRRRAGRGHVRIRDLVHAVRRIIIKAI